MDIKCHKCGTIINLNESIKNSIINEEKEIIKAEMNANHQREIDEIKAERSLIKMLNLRLRKNRCVLKMP